MATNRELTERDSPHQSVYGTPQVEKEHEERETSAWRKSQV